MALLFQFSTILTLDNVGLQLKSWSKLLRKFWFWTSCSHNYDKVTLVFVQKCPPHPPFGDQLNHHYYHHHKTFKVELTLSPENPTHSNNFMMIGGSNDKTYKAYTTQHI